MMQRSFQGEVELSHQIIHHIISEPGDCTRYNYFMIKDHDEYKFVPYDNTFNYPQRINRFVIPDELPKYADHKIDSVLINNIAQKYNCNPWTVVECMGAIKELEKNEQ